MPQVFFLCTYTIIEGSFGSFGFADLAIFWGGFSVLALEICSFLVLVACAAYTEVFSNLSLWFTVFVKNDHGFWGFSVTCKLRFFLVFPRLASYTLHLH